MSFRPACLFFGLLVLGIVLGIGVFVARAGQRGSYIEGMVVDSSTGAPLPGVSVAVSNRGWGFIDGRLVWDKDFVYETATDVAGRFRIVYQVGSSAHVLASKAGYEPYDDWHNSNSTITIRLKKLTGSYRPLPHGILELGMRDYKPYGWVFSERQITFDREEADLFPDADGTGNGPASTFSLYAPGGIIFVPEAALGAGDSLVFADTAPSGGYVPSITFDPQQKGGIYFVKTRNGRQYTKFVATSTTSGSEADIRRGTWGLRLEYVYNPDGTPTLIFQR